MQIVWLLSTSLEWLLKSLLHYVTLMIIIADILCSAIDDNHNAERTVCENLFMVTLKEKTESNLYSS